MKKLITIALLCAMLLSALASCGVQVGKLDVEAYAAEGDTADVAFKTELDADADVWDGTTTAEPTLNEETGFYEISTGAQLRYFLATLCGGITTGEVGMEGETYVLTNDIDVSVENWETPDSTKYFGGTFDGNGHVIKYKAQVTGAGYRSLLGSVGGNATIKNLSVIGTFTNNLTAAKNHAGAVLTRAYTVADQTVTISNVYANVDFVTGSGITVKLGNGGALVSHVEGTGDLLIENCENAGDINLNGTSATGIVNYVKSSKNVTIKNCNVTGSLTAVGSKCAGIIGDVTALSGNLLIQDCNVSAPIGATSNVNGGILAYVTGVTGSVTIQNCTVSGNIKGTSSTGGIIGRSVTTQAITIKGCTVSGNVTGTTQTAGIFGYLANGGSATTVILQNCKVTGKVSATTMSGGILGYVANKVTDLQFLNCDFTGSYTGSRTSGGIAGTISTSNAILLKDCDVTATLTFNLTDTKNNNGAGLVGRLQSNATITNCKVNSTITANHTGTTTTDTSMNGAAGLVGCVYKNITLDLYNNTVAGTITFNNTSTSVALNAGNFVGALFDDTAAVNYYWNNKTSAKITTTGDGTVALGELDPDLVALGYQEKDNGDGTYALRFVFAAKNTEAIDALGVEAGIAFNDPADENTFKEGKLTVYAPVVYKSVKDENGTVYAAADYGYEYIYTLVINNIPEACNIAAKNLYITLDPFSATGETSMETQTKAGVCFFGTALANTSATNVEFTIDDFSKTLPTAFATPDISIDGAEYDASKSFGVADTQVPKSECAGDYADDTLTRPIHYYAANEGDIANYKYVTQQTYTFTVTEAGTYDLCIYMRVKGDSAIRENLVLIDGKVGAEAYFFHFDIDGASAVKDDSAGSYMTGFSVYLEAGEEHTITFKWDERCTTFSTLHIRNIYLVKQATTPAE